VFEALLNVFDPLGSLKKAPSFAGTCLVRRKTSKTSKVAVFAGKSGRIFGRFSFPVPKIVQWNGPKRILKGDEVP
jgi:hypothetical protein